MPSLVAQAREGNRRAVARLITKVERSEDEAREVVVELYRHTGNAHIVGITGPPGSGKSTLVNRLAKELRDRRYQVGIIAVDPSSPFSGGALLGDRIRMRDLAGDPGIFIRSMASRGSLGGLARATAAAIKVLDAAGFDLILVETVGAGQAEVDIANAAHTTVVIEAPGMGDDIQSIKAGILEIADILVVNKADKPGAANTVKALQMMLQLGSGSTMRAHPPDAARDDDGDRGDRSEWSVRVYETIATEGRGVTDVVEAIRAHKSHLHDTGQWWEREQDRSRHEIEQLLQARMFRLLRENIPDVDRQALVAAVASRETDPYSAVTVLFEKLSDRAWAFGR